VFIKRTRRREASTVRISTVNLNRTNFNRTKIKRLLCFPMRGVGVAKPAVFLGFHPVGMRLFVFCGVVVSLFAVYAG
jgi:hypothetical protein